MWMMRMRNLCANTLPRNSKPQSVWVGLNRAVHSDSHLKTQRQNHTCFQTVGGPAICILKFCGLKQSVSIIEVSVHKPRVKSYYARADVH